MATIPTCRNCGAPATCYGTYEKETGYACDECCGHGCEDGHCERIACRCENEDCRADLCEKCGHCLTCHDEDPVNPCASAKKNHQSHS